MKTIKKKGEHLVMLVAMFLLFQVCINAQQETVPNNGVLLVNKTSSPIKYNVQSCIDGKWRDTGYELSPGADRIETDMCRIAIYEGSNPHPPINLTFKTRYKFFWNPEIAFWDIKIITR